MSCPHCGRPKGAKTPPCPRCEVPSATQLPVRYGAQDHSDAADSAQRPRVVDPEVLAPGEGRQDGDAARRARDFLQQWATGQSQQAPYDPQGPQGPQAPQDRYRGPSGQQDQQWQQAQNLGTAFRFITFRHLGQGGFGGGGFGGFGGGQNGAGPSGMGPGTGPGLFTTMGRDSCLPGMITLGIMLVCAVQFGVLAALGFGIFYLLGSAFMLIFQVRQAMQGRALHPLVGSWLGRMAVWAGSWVLAGWLSGGLR